MKNDSRIGILGFVCISAVSLAILQFGLNYVSRNKNEINGYRNLSRMKISELKSYLQELVNKDEPECYEQAAIVRDLIKERTGETV